MPINEFGEIVRDSAVEEVRWPATPLAVEMPSAGEADDDPENIDPRLLPIYQEEEGDEVGPDDVVGNVVKVFEGVGATVKVLWNFLHGE